MSAKPSLFKTSDGRNYAVTFIFVSSLFLLWGFCNGLIDVLDKHFQNTMHISKAQSALVQFANYMGYFLMALPAGYLARKFGYKGGILFGLGFIAAGALWFIPATQIGTFWGFLTGLFILAAGMTCLETVANPYATVLGPPDFGAARINLAQSCNGVGWILGPIVGSHFVFSSAGATVTTNEHLYIPYLGIAVVVALLIVVFSFAKMPDIPAQDNYGHEAGRGRGSLRVLWAHPHFTLAVAAQFFYVAAQTGIFSFFINYMDTETPAIPPGLADLVPQGWGWLQSKPDGLRLSEFGAAHMLSIGGFGLFLLGRFIGSLLLRKIDAARLLGVYAVVNAALMGLILMRASWLSPAAVFLSFFFMSVMFPSIFALGIHGLGEHTKKASSFIVMSIVGGAIMPPLMGHIADRSSMTMGFMVPLGCFVLIACYAFGWRKLSGKQDRVAVSVTKGH